MKTKKPLLLKEDSIEVVLSAVETRTSVTCGEVMKAHANGVKVGIWSDMIAAWEAQIKMRVEDGIAIIPIRGAITPDDPFAAYFGDTSLTAFNKNFQIALKDSSVKAIVLDISSPGGYVYGVEAASNAIFAAKSKKPVIGFTGSLAASAAYWLISACSKVVLASETSEVGSIGVYMAHFDYSEMMDKMGIKVTEITAGKYKGIGSPYVAPTAEELKLMQQDVDYIQTRFVDTALVRNRGMSQEAALKVANGLTYSGSEAISLGLADSIQSLQEVIMEAGKDVVKADAATPAPVLDVVKPGVSAEVTAEQKELAELRAQVKANNEATKAAADKAVADECKALIKGALGREASEQEVAAYAAMTPESRTAQKAQFAEFTARTDKVVKAAGLTQEVIEHGADPANDPNNNPLIAAGRTLGVMVAKQ